MIGQKIAHYEVTEKLGEGGMGEVYRARDTRLNRDVALKILPQVFAQDSQRMARFEREAQVLASLNHSNIAQIYGLEEMVSGPETRDSRHSKAKALVLELVPGETLQEQIARGPIPVDEALKIALQICEGLEAAHEKGIIHRDLKPANIKITLEGQVKILDFGLAKALEAEMPASELSHSPTISHMATQAGVILGTASYMSPEQARGKPVDKRTDIWAFGCVLYEMLTGRKTFSGEDVSDTLASVLRDEPNWKALAGNSPAIVELLKKSLRKDSSFRLRDIRDLRLDLMDLATDEEGTTAFPVARRTWKVRLPWFIAGLMVVIAAVALWSSLQGPNEGSAAPQRFNLDLPFAYAKSFAPTLAISPNGRLFVYVAAKGDQEQVYRRDIGQIEGSIIEGTDGARRLFFSPDSEWLGFWADEMLQKVSMRGGTPLPICPMPDVDSIHGAKWGKDGEIILGSLNSGLSVISASGGTPKAITNPDRAKGELGHLWPEVLPGGEAILFTIWSGGTYDQARIAVFSQQTGQWRTLVEGGSFPRYSPTGHLLYVFSKTLMAVRFDLNRLRIEGDPIPVLEELAINPRGVSHFDFSNDGMLVYWSGIEDRSLVWVDHEGQTETAIDQRRDFSEPSISPDGKLVTVRVYDGKTNNIYLAETLRGTLTPHTFDSVNESPVWTPDGKHITFASEQQGSINLFQISSDAIGDPERLAESPNMQVPTSWSPEGDILLFQERHPETNWDLWLLRPGDVSASEPWLVTGFIEKQATFSPDGKWIAFTSDRSGQDEIYLRNLSGEGGIIPVSTGGGSQPVWGSRGEQIYYRVENRLLEVKVALKPTVEIGDPETLFEGSFKYQDLNVTANYDISPDGSRFLMIRGAERTKINVVLNWFEELKRLVPTE